MESEPRWKSENEKDLFEAATSGDAKSLVILLQKGVSPNLNFNVWM